MIDVLGSPLPRRAPLSYAIAARVEEAGSDDLERWTERIMTASCIDEVLR